MATIIKENKKQFFYFLDPELLTLLMQKIPGRNVERKKAVFQDLKGLLIFAKEAPENS